MMEQEMDAESSRTSDIQRTRLSKLDPSPFKCS